MIGNGIILILHSIHRTISEEEALSYLPESYLKHRRKVISVQPTQFKLSESYHQDYHTLGAQQRHQYRENIKPLIENDNYSKIVYFGAAPIALAMQLGFLIGEYEDVEIYQHHHDLNTWKWQRNTPSKALKSQVENKPKDHYRGHGDVQIRMSTSVRVDESHCEEVLKAPVKEIHITVDKPTRDVFGHPAELTEVAGKFRDTLDLIQSNLPDIDYIHFFGAIPVGLAFLLGTKINPTMHKPVQTYQFGIAEIPKYTAAVLIQNNSTAQWTISQKEIEEAKKTRALLDDMLQNQVGGFIQNIKEKEYTDWFTSIFPKAVDTSLFHAPQWKNLPLLSELRLLNDRITCDLSTNDVEGFFYDKGKSTWLLSDAFIISLRKRFEQEKEFQQAIRMFLFHESLHITQHLLTSNNSSGIGGFPKVVEAADYQADVWAMFYEYKYTALNNRKALENPRDYFLSLINTAIHTMWSFFPQPATIRRIQIRRVNRFLMWYFQFLLIEELPQNSKLDDIILVLLQKPIIELSGPYIRSDQQRTYFYLNLPNVNMPELALFHNNKVHRSIQNNAEILIAAFRDKDTETIKQYLRGIVESSSLK
ncbi:MAG: SAVED domain-containing protein [Bacteroidota bacterium]